MADPNPPTPKTTTTKRKSPSPIDAKLVAKLVTDKEIISAIIDEINSDAAFASALASHFIDAANTIPATLVNIQAVLAQADAASAVAADATSGTASFHDVTDEEEGDMKTAITAIRGVQARAKEKYEETNPALLDAYYVGQPLSSRLQVTQAATAAYTRLRTTDDDGNPVTPQDTLPGYDQAKIDQLKAELGIYAGVQTKQSGAQEVATDKRGDFKTDSQQVSRRRRRLQLAIDAEYPHGPANTARRRRLRLPTTKGMS
jgi:hypothetical protein